MLPYALYIIYQVRAAAVTALAKFGAQVADLQPSICVLLERCLTDEDDEVRDRATYYLSVLRQQNQQLNNNYIINGIPYFDLDVFILIYVCVYFMFM